MPLTVCWTEPIGRVNTLPARVSAWADTGIRTRGSGLLTVWP